MCGGRCVGETITYALTTLNKKTGEGVASCSRASFVFALLLVACLTLVYVERGFLLIGLSFS